MLTPLLISSAGLDQLQQPRNFIKPELPTGKVLKRRLGGYYEQTYYLYIPRSAGKSAPLMVSIHGVSRNAKQHARMLSSMAEQYGVILLAPLFSKKQFPDYQRLGRLGRGPRSDLALDRIIGEVVYLSGADTGRLYLFGYSGGGQFAHRYAMAHPERVAAVVIGAAGWYTFPDKNNCYPRGIASIKSLPSLRFDQTRFLRIPMTVIVGDQDIERDPELNKSPRIDRRQGLNRVERARNWIESMNRATAAHDIAAHHRLTILPGIGHSFEQGVELKAMNEKIFSSLFDATDPFDREIMGTCIPSSPVGQNSLIA
jgi:poly(3-hydroxybutyrate) depolymerase